MTFHGFRYVEVDGWPGELTLSGAGARGGGRALRPAPDRPLRLLGRAAQPAAPQRRLGHAGQLPRRPHRLPAARRAPRLDRRHRGVRADRGVPVRRRGLPPDWLADLDVEQRAADGLVPFVVPDALKYTAARGLPGRPATHRGLGDAAVWVPWALWQAYGDGRSSRQYAAMAAHVAASRRCSRRPGCGTRVPVRRLAGPDRPPDEPWRGQGRQRRGRDRLPLPQRAHRRRGRGALGRDRRRRRTSARWPSELRAAFNKHYVSDDGRSAATRSRSTRWRSCSTCSTNRRDAGRGPAGGARGRNGHHIATGFAGTPYICDALTSTGHLDDAYRLLLQRECPSWLYPVTMGATTIWERWDSMLPDGTINPGQMTSFNHYAFGAVADWMHRDHRRIRPAEPGYRTRAHRASARRGHDLGRDRTRHPARARRGQLAGRPRRASAGRCHVAGRGHSGGRSPRSACLRIGPGSHRLDGAIPPRKRPG